MIEDQGVKSDPLLDVRDLHIRYRSSGRTVHAVDDVSFTLNRGESLGIVGESGSGKTSLALSVARLLPRSRNCIEMGSVFFDGENLSSMPERNLVSVHGSRLGFVFQDPLRSLNPFLSVGFQISEVLLRHSSLTRVQRRNRVVELLDEVGIPDARRRLKNYPNQFSGGMRQRVMIAMALACKPKLVIADEPTSALDASTRFEIMELLNSLRRSTGTALLLITHDLQMASAFCDRLIVMYAGQTVETGPTREVLGVPDMPYTSDLLACIPTLATDPSARVPAIPGGPPDLSVDLVGCRYAARCSFARDVCRSTTPDLIERAFRHAARCHGTDSGGWVSTAQLRMGDKR